MDKRGYNYLIELKTLWEMEKVLVTSNFSIFHVFKNLLLMRQNEYLWSKGLKEFGKQSNIHLFIRSQRPETTGIGDKDPN